MKRRSVLLGGLGVAAAGVAVRRAMAPVSGPHDAYFARLNAVTKEFGAPVMVIDKARFLENAKVITSRVAAAKLQLRLVVKSLPSLPLLDLIGVQKYMAFNTSMLAALWARDPAADVLLGKPMPIAAVRALWPFTAENTQWLIDTEQRLAEYEAFAREHAVKLKVSLELDVGLHRGGFTTPPRVTSDWLQLAGLMGYDAHLGKTPGALKGRAFAASQAAFKAAAEGVTGVLNSGGSMTWMHHLGGTVANELAIGSAFVMPSDFEQPELKPAAFIATPVLKKVSPAAIPGLELLSGVRSLVMPETAQGVFVFGGHWLANPCSPPGLGFSDLYGRSSNQELLIAGDDLKVDVGDCVFYRPTQSEAVLNGFGELVVIGETVERFSVLT